MKNGSAEVSYLQNQKYMKTDVSPSPHTSHNKTAFALFAVKDLYTKLGLKEEE